MTIYEKIIAVYPELSSEFMDGTIILRNDADDKGDYIYEWNYEKPIPYGLKVGKEDIKNDDNP